MDRSPILKQLISIQETGNPDLTIDFSGDCKDLWELVTGLKTLPQDKGQRLDVLGIKEARLSGKMRQILLVPSAWCTDQTIGPQEPAGTDDSWCGEFSNAENHPVTSRILPTLQEYSEHDIIKTDEEILEDVKKNPDNIRVSHESILLVRYISSKVTETRNKRFVVKAEPEDESQPMDVDDPTILMEVDEDDLAQHYGALRKRVRKLEIENDELQVTVKIKEAADGFKQQYEEKMAESKSWEDSKTWRGSSEIWKTARWTATPMLCGSTRHSSRNSSVSLIAKKYYMKGTRPCRRSVTS